MTKAPYAAIYDFELLPYALGDALTWCVQSACRATDAGRNTVDVYICMDERYPSIVYQRDLVVPENCALFFSELFGAFGAHPFLGNILIYTDRDALLARLREIARDDAINAAALADYEAVLNRRGDEEARKSYFIKYIYSHEALNDHHARRGEMPMLSASRGCEPDVEALLTRALAGKRIVVIHPRLRRLDNGLGGEHTYARDSDFLEWYEFVRLAGQSHPDVKFVVTGRLQEKPIELLRLPNVLSLRSLGLGLGHELTLILKADLFIGTSSGFAAMANFCAVPYFITRMNPESCNAYAIPQGATRLPFALAHQHLVYEPETTAMLTGLLERGLALPPRRPPTEGPKRSDAIDVHGFNAYRAQWLFPAATTSRYFLDDSYADQETAFLVLPKLQAAGELLKQGDVAGAKAVAARIERHFPRFGDRYPELSAVRAGQRPPMNLKAEVKFALRRFAFALNRRAMPNFLRDTKLHWLARRLKTTLLSRTN